MIEVPYTFKQIETFKDTLYQDLRTLAIQGDVSVSSTLTGRKIEVHVLDAGVLPDSFGSEVPDDAFEIIESETVGTLEG